MDFFSYLQNIFPKKNRLISFLYGFATGFALIMPHSDCFSKVTWLVIYGTFFVFLCMYFYLVSQKKHLIMPNGWGAVGLVASGGLFCVLSVFDGLLCLNSPIAMVVAGGMALLVAFWKGRRKDFNEV